MTDSTPSSSVIGQYDLLLLDLDGVVYVGEQPVPGAVRVLAELRHRQVPVCFVTNNASRSAQAVTDLLNRIGIAASEAEVLTSAQAAVQLLVERLPADSPVLVVGAPALSQEVAASGLIAVTALEDKPVAVLQGYGPDVSWRQLAEAAVALNAGALWVATNTDRTLPSERGPLPGNGALVAALTVATGRHPDVVVGKPQPELFFAAARRFNARCPLVVGDRLDTDIAAGDRAGFDSMLVLTGVADAAAVVAASPPGPRYLGDDLTALLAAYPEVTTRVGATRCGGWTVSATSRGCQLAGTGEPIDALRAIAAAVGTGLAKAGTEVFPAGESAERALRRLGLLG